MKMIANSRVKLMGSTFVFVVLAVVGIGANKYWYRANGNESALSEVIVATVRQGDIDRVERAIGRVIAPSSRKRSFPAAGVLRTLDVEEGAYVRLGDVLATLEPDADLTEKLATAKADLESAVRRVRLAQEAVEQEKGLYLAGVESRQALEKKEQALADESDKQRRAQVTLRALEQKALQSILRADGNAQVVAIDLVRGQAASNAQGVTLIDPTSLEIEVKVDEATAAQLKVGQRATYDVMAKGGRPFQGESKVTRIFPSYERNIDTGANMGMAGAAHGIKVRFAVAAEQMSMLHVNQQVQMQLQMEARKQVLLVPTRAVMSEQGRQFVITLEDSGKVRWVPVETGIEQRDVTEIRDAGVSPGMRIVIPVSTPPLDGQMVRVRAE